MQTLKYMFLLMFHLLKLLRNNFLDHGFINAGIKINKTCLERLLKASNSDIKIAHKISRYHLEKARRDRKYGLQLKYYRTKYQKLSNGMEYLVLWKVPPGRKCRAAEIN